MRQRMIRFYKVQWSRHSKQEATWETEEFIPSIESFSLRC
jgi:hypothetical protein